MTQILSQPHRGGHGHGQWRHKTQAVATQNTDSGDVKHGIQCVPSAFRRCVKYCTTYNELYLADTQNGTTEINSVLLGFDSCEHSGFNAVQHGMFYTDKHTASIFNLVRSSEALALSH